jgi:hypothetical protein
LRGLVLPFFFTLPHIVTFVGLSFSTLVFGISHEAVLGYFFSLFSSYTVSSNFYFNCWISVNSTIVPYLHYYLFVFNLAILSFCETEDQSPRPPTGYASALSLVCVVVAGIIGMYYHSWHIFCTSDSV